MSQSGSDMVNDAKSDTETDRHMLHAMWVIQELSAACLPQHSGQKSARAPGLASEPASHIKAVMLIASYASNLRQGKIGNGSVTPLVP